MPKSIAALAIAAFSAGAADAYETRAYEVERAEAQFEVRAYPPAIAAEVDVRADGPKDAAGEAFMTLFRYIGGGNTPRAGIDMTTLVEAAPRGEKIDMTTPVEAGPARDGVYTVRFYMPAAWTMETLPRPKDPKVRIARTPAERAVVIRYRGGDTARKRAARETELRAFAEREGLEIVGPVKWAAFDGPMTPWFLQDFELMAPVSPAAN